MTPPAQPFDDAEATALASGVAQYEADGLARLCNSMLCAKQFANRWAEEDTKNKNDNSRNQVDD